MDNLLVRTCRGEQTERVPVWMMRQAGRYMAEYRALKEQHDFWTICRTPELATEVTMQPIRAFAPDAAILFSDILVVLPAMGINVEFAPGPIVHNPATTVSDINKLRHPDMKAELGFVFEAVRSIRQTLPSQTGLIGFGGAPLTLASYMVDGRQARNFENLKQFFYTNKETGHQLMKLLADVQSEFLTHQVDAGAQVVQLFDTWAGSMPTEIIEEFVIPHTARLIDNIKKTGAPVIYFMKNAAHVLDMLHLTGADIISVDERQPLDVCANAIKAPTGLQGNLDSAILFTDQQTITAHVERIITQAPKDRPFVFNLGHGILPQTPVDNAAHFIAEVKRLGVRDPQQ